MFAEKMDRFIDAYCENYRFSGTLRVTLRDEIIYERLMGYADLEKGIPVTRDSIYTFYSMSKPFCTMGLLKLMDRGLVDLDRHPGYYVPEAQGFDSRVTIRHMLHHVSGLPDFLQNPEFPQKYVHGPAEKTREHLKILSTYPMYFEPGTRQMYANINFTVSALIIENVSGMLYDDYMRQEVFAPLGMHTARIDHEGLQVENRVVGYDLNGAELVPTPKLIDWVMGGGDVLGTVDDAYALNRAVKHKLLLKPETWAEALTPSPLNSMGMGCTVSTWHGRRRITHNGGHRGFRTLHAHLTEEDLDIILLSNCGFGDSRGTLPEAVYAAYFGDDTPAGNAVKMDTGYIRSSDTAPAANALICQKPAEVPLSAEEEARYLGKYGPFKLEKADTYYILHHVSGGIMHCYPMGGGLFANMYADEKYPFRTDANGCVSLYGLKKEV